MLRAKQLPGPFDALTHLEVIATSLPGFSDASLPAAAARAGAVGLLNLTHHLDPHSAARTARELAQVGSPRVGLILRARRGEVEQAALAAIDAAELVLLVADPEVDLAAAVTDVRRHAKRVGVVVTSRDQALRAASAGCDLLVAKGHESGGFVGEETSFVLAQGLVSAFELPLYVWGGISWNTAAACAAVGCAGVVVDWQLALLRESPLTDEVRRRIAQMDGSEIATQPCDQGQFLRFYHQPGLTARDRLARLGTQSRTAAIDWQQHVTRLIQELHPRDRLLLAGQDAAFAADWARHAASVGRALRLLEARVVQQVQAAAKAQILAPGSPLAASHGTHFPVVQGPMTRVSDVAGFCHDVARDGGLPFLALALMNETQVRSLLAETKAKLGSLPWGVGVLGFVPQEIRAQQWPAIREFRPPYAVIAGGRPDQAASLEAEGIATYLHVPSPGMLDMFLREGARRFVFEGRECGGHVGPRTSFVLWETMIRVLLAAELSDAEAAQVHVLFAGGIHDRLGAAMVAVLAQPLVDRGMKVGVLLGTAYLFTREIVASGALVEGFQSVAVSTKKTVVVESGPGHAIRCAETEFVELFEREKRRLETSSISPEEQRIELEQLNLGRLRIAAKGVTRTAGDSGLTALDAERQRAAGMYMIGQVASLRDRVCTIRELHEEVCQGAANLLSRTTATEVLPPSRTIRPRPLDIAIVGLACLVPGATTAGRLWHNILTKHSPITEIPPDRFEADRWFDGDRKARDKIYGKWGGFVADLPFDPLKYGIPPASIPSIEPMQLLAMELVDRALRDAGYGDQNPLRERTSIVLGVGGGAGELGANYAFRAMLPRFLENPDESLWGQLPEWTEDSFAGILFNVVAGRVSNRFDFGGVNCTIDAACASSLAAVYWACHELASGQCDMAISGGCDTMQNPFGYLCFAKAGALSPRGVPRVFDADADGIVISEGHAAVVLKRREDAERDGDKIYALIRAVSSGSDGRSKGLTAPRMEGQLRTLRRAYAQAGVDPASVRLFEAHGTGTAVGDQTEGLALTTLLAEANAPPQSVAVGSIKSMIGHTKCAAGAVGLVKAVMALQHRVLPPTLHVERPNPKAGLVDGPLFANTEARPWLEHAGPRRAGVSSFGFGGTNFHVLLEEYDRSPTARPVAARADRARELFIVGADEPAGIPPALRALTREAECLSQTEIDSAFARFAYTQHLRTARVAKPIRAALIAASLSELHDLLQKFAAALNERGEITGKLPAGVHYTAQPPLAGETAFLFPGQGSQHPGMLQELAVEYPEVRACLERADAQLEPILGDRLSKFLHPAPAYSDADRMRGVEELKATHIAQPALGACGRAIHLLLEAFGLRASMYAGHSFGELVALAAAGAVSEATLLQLAAARGQAMAQAGDSPRGAMLAVSATAAQIKTLIHGVADVWLANRNSPSQTVLSGSTAGVAAAQAKLEAAGVAVRQLPVSAAFHTPYMNAPRDAFRATLAAAEISTPTGRVYSNVTAAAYAGDVTQIRTLLAEQLTSEVRFVEQIERMYQEGARIFVEVGPKGVLTGLVREILRGRPHVAIATQSTVDGGAERFLSALAQLAVNGVDVSLDRLYEQRELEPLDRATLAGAVPEPLKPHMWLVNGAYARRVGQPRRDTSPQARLASSHEPFIALQQQTGGPTAYREESVENEPSMPAPPGRDAAPPRQIATANHIASENGSAGHPPEPAAPAGGGMSSNDYALFQQTMRQFLQTQESVLRHLFGGGSGAAPQGAIEAAPPVLVAAPPATLQTPPVGESPASSADGVEPAVSPAAARQPVSAARPATASPPMPESPAPKTRAPSISEPSHESADSLPPRLIAIVAERTGYPAEMLGLDINLEGELGIDSIKRVEIIAAFRREAIPGMQEPPPEFMEHLAAAKTMRRILEVVSQMRGGPATAPPAATAEGPHSHAPAQLDPDDLLTTLLRIVAERTGYPAEMLDLDIHLESELGIDSIKRVEIIAAFRREVRPDLVEPPPELMERLTAAKTMRSIIDALSMPGAANGRGATASPVANQPASTGAASEHGAECPRCVAEAVEAPMTRLDQLSAGAVIVSADDHGIANHWAEQLRAAGHPVVQLSHADLADRESARRAIEIVRREFGAIAAVAHLAPLDVVPPWPTISRRAWQERFALDVEGMLYLLQALEPELTAPGPRVRVLCASLGAGDFARPETVNEREATHPWRGGLAGLLKVAACEWPQHSFRTVDFTELPTSEQLDRELRAAGAVEIAYRGTQRLTVETRRAELPALETPHAAATLTRDSVVLVTGGAKGITAQIVAELARQVPARLILLGRSPLPDAEESSATAGIEPDHLLRPAIIGQLRTAGESLTPARVEAELARIKSDRELRRNLAAIAATGAEVEYVVCDLRDPRALEQTLQALQDKYGVIDALIHGAGIIDDRAIKDKTTSSFERVVGTKVDSLLDLLARIDLARLRLIALFGSTSGIFGNSGQGDYAAANEILNRCARRLQSIWSGKVVTLNWGPWSGAGMVTPEVAEKMRAQGVDLIPVAAGSAAACREILSPRGDNPRVVLGRGPWLDAERLRAGRLDLSASGPLLAGHSVEVGGDGRVVARVKLNPQTRYLRDHCIEGKAVLPVAVAVGFMAEAAHRARPAWHVASVANVRMLGGITVEGAGREIIVAAEPLGQESGVGHWRVRITAADVPQRTLYDAEVELVESLPAAPPLSEPSAISAPLAASASEAYDRWLFHGPMYQVIEGFGGADETGIDALVRGSAMPVVDGASVPWVLDPVVVDAAPQLAMIWSRALYDIAVLPSRISSYRVYAPPGDGPVEMRLRVRPGSDRQVYHADVWIVRDGKLIAHMEGLEGAGGQHLNRIAISGAL